MSLSIPRLSFVIASRNDTHCGDSVGRLKATLNHLDDFFCDNEIIVVDWGSKEPLKENGHSHRHIIVPPTLTSSYGPHMNEVVALNVGVRRARGLYVARIDQDTLPGLKFRQWTTELPDNGRAPAYFSERRELLADWGNFRNALEPNAAYRWSEQQLPSWNPSWTSQHFWATAVGVLLAPRAEWHRLRGYDERLKYRNHMEHDLCKRFERSCGLVDLGPIVDYDFYHQFHERPRGIPSNEMPSDEYLASCPLVLNDENWGLGQHKLEERYL